jgi:hypothetical protein
MARGPSQALRAAREIHAGETEVASRSTNRALGMDRRYPKMMKACDFNRA